MKEGARNKGERGRREMEGERWNSKEVEVRREKTECRSEDF